MFAIIQNNTVTDTLRVDPTTIYPPAYASQFVPAPQGVERGWLLVAGELVAPPAAPLLTRQTAAWERIKDERDRRKVLGVKVGAHWFHSDTDSRVQQLGLVIMGASVPAVQWKTLTLAGQPVFVTMTQTIAGGIFQGTAESDAAIFAAAEAHRAAMEASDMPERYDIASGWPASIEDET